MHPYLSKIKRFYYQLLGFFPAHLPTGLADLGKFCDDLFFTYELPDLPSYRHAVASMIMHLSPTTIRKPKRFFALSVKKAMANQVAFELIQQIKEKEKEETSKQYELSV
jgi:hypothetical protein